VTEVITPVGQRVLYTFVYTSPSFTWPEVNITHLCDLYHFQVVIQLSTILRHQSSTTPTIWGLASKEAGDGAPQAPPFRIVSFLSLPFRRVLICTSHKIEALDFHSFLCLNFAFGKTCDSRWVKTFQIVRVDVY
jgi:hypothetical protein